MEIRKLGRERDGCLRQVLKNFNPNPPLTIYSHLLYIHGILTKDTRNQHLRYKEDPILFSLTLRRRNHLLLHLQLPQPHSSTTLRSNGQFTLSKPLVDRIIRSGIKFPFADNAAASESPEQICSVLRESRGIKVLAANLEAVEEEFVRNIAAFPI